VEGEGSCQSLPEACSGKECILSLERDDPSSKNAEGERQCNVMGNGTEGHLVHVPAKDTLEILDKDRAGERQNPLLLQNCLFDFFFLGR
jgi:hypothetical protein